LRAKRDERKTAVVAEAVEALARAPPSVTQALVDPLASTKHAMSVTQLSRGGKAFTKADLVALLECVSRGSVPSHEAYVTMSCDDLCTAIRLQLYKPAGAASALDRPAPAAVTLGTQAHPMLLE